MCGSASIESQNGMCKNIPKYLLEIYRTCVSLRAYPIEVYSWSHVHDEAAFLYETTGI